MEFVAIAIIVFLLGLFVWWAKHRRRRAPQIELTRWHDPADYRCEICGHRTVDHADLWAHGGPHCIEGCRCALSQANVWKRAQRWAVTPPPSDVLERFINQTKETDTQ